VIMSYFRFSLEAKPTPLCLELSVHYLFRFKLIISALWWNFGDQRLSTAVRMFAAASAEAKWDTKSLVSIWLSLVSLNASIKRHHSGTSLYLNTRKKSSFMDSLWWVLYLMIYNSSFLISEITFNYKNIILLHKKLIIIFIMPSLKSPFEVAWPLFTYFYLFISSILSLQI